MALTWAVLAVCLLAACGRTVPSRFYMLTPGVQKDASTKEMPDDVTLGVGPVAIPFYLDRPNIVTRIGPNQVALSEFDKWAGSLKEDVPKVMAENLSRLLNTDRIEIFPWSAGAGIDFQVAVDILRLDAVPEQEAVLEARWSLLKGDPGRTVHIRKSVIRTPVAGDGYPAMVAALSETLGALCREIAPEVPRAANAGRK